MFRGSILALLCLTFVSLNTEADTFNKYMKQLADNIPAVQILKEKQRAPGGEELWYLVREKIQVLLPMSDVRELTDQKRMRTRERCFIEVSFVDLKTGDYEVKVRVKKIVKGKGVKKPEVAELSQELIIMEPGLSDFLTMTLEDEQDPTRGAKICVGSCNGQTLNQRPGWPFAEWPGVELSMDMMGNIKSVNVRGEGKREILHCE